MTAPGATDPRDFQLDPRLAADTLALATSELSELRLMNDAQYPWLILVPRRSGIREIFELSSAEQQQLLRESSALGEAMMQVFGGRKLNVAALGNAVEQLHLHHIVRFENDAAWPRPVWGTVAPRAYSVAAFEQVRAQLVPVIAAYQNISPMA